MGKGELNASQCQEAPDQGHTAQHQRSSPNMLFRLAMVMVAVVSGEGVGVTQFNASFAKALQQLNAASLCPPKSLTLWSCTRCNGSMLGITSPADVAVINLPKDQLLGLVVKSHTHKSIIMVARGTVDNDVLDWLDDAEVWQDKFAPTPAYSGALVHHGFHLAWSKLKQGMYDALDLALKDPATQGYDVITTGHSLGASISALLTAELLAAAAQEWHMPIGQYTFGEPRTGNHAFASAVVAAEGGYAAGAYTWRVVNKRDIVPHLPLLNTLGAKYWHQSQEVWLAPNGTTIICDTTGEDQRCSDSIPLLKTRPADHTTYYGWDAGPCNA